MAQRFAREIEAQSKKGTAAVVKKFFGKKIIIDVFPNVFPPGSEKYSASSDNLCLAMENVNGKNVLDMGCGTGILSLIAAAGGAKQIDAADINPDAVACTKHNASANGLEKKIFTYESDLFSALPPKKYDIIIFNLPIVDFDPENIPVSIKMALYDPQLSIHDRFLANARKYLHANGCIVFGHANLQSANTAQPLQDFQEIDSLLEKHGYTILQKKEAEYFQSCIWATYHIAPM